MADKKLGRNKFHYITFPDSQELYDCDPVKTTQKIPSFW